MASFSIMATSTEQIHYVFIMLASFSNHVDVGADEKGQSFVPISNV
jgi:hypothetical protein